MTTASPLSRLFSYARPYRTRLVWAVVAMALYAIGSAGLAALIKTIFDNVLQDRSRLGAVAWAIIVLNILKGIGSYGSAYLMAWVGQKVVTDIRDQLYAHILGQSAAFFAQRSHGQLMSRIGNDVLDTLTSAFNPLPAIALLPLALIWFGLGDVSIIFVLVHSVLWAVALNTHSGFRSVSNTLRMVGRNYGLKGPRLIAKILIPAAFPSILTGLKIGWAFAWRTLIAAELVFGVSSGSGGLGWFIFENRNLLDTANVFAGLATVMAVGLIVEGVIFRTIENKTIRRWGMQHG